LKFTIPNDVVEHQLIRKLKSKILGDIMNKLHIAVAALGITLALPALAQNVQDKSNPQNPEAANQSSPVGQGAKPGSSTNKPSASDKVKQKRKQGAKSLKENDAANKSGTGTSSKDVPDSNQGRTMKPEESQPDSAKKRSSRHALGVKAGD
jgi:hypothetical protein